MKYRLTAQILGTILLVIALLSTKVIARSITSETVTKKLLHPFEQKQ